MKRQALDGFKSAGPMKAITLWQPWASLMAVGAKRNETRGWATSYRGDLAICAAKRPVPTWTDMDAAFVEAVCGYGSKLGFAAGARYGTVACGLPRGAVVAVVDLYSVVRTDDANLESSVVRPLGPHERLFGDYAPGRFAWLTRNLRTLRTPVPVVGRQGLFNLDAETERLVRASMGHSDEVFLDS